MSAARGHEYQYHQAVDNNGAVGESSNLCGGVTNNHACGTGFPASGKRRHGSAIGSKRFRAKVSDMLENVPGQRLDVAVTVTN